VLARAQSLVKVLPGDRWLQSYVHVYTACRDMLCGDVRAVRESLPRAVAAVRSGDFRMETLLRVYQARFEFAQGRDAQAREAAAEALGRATDPVMENPFDEILARRALAPLVPLEEGLGHLKRALALAEDSRNVLQVGLVNMGMAELWLELSPREASRVLDAAEKAFVAAGAPGLLGRVTTLREDVMQRLGLRTTA